MGEAEKDDGVEHELAAFGEEFGAEATGVLMEIAHSGLGAACALSTVRTSSRLRRLSLATRTMLERISSTRSAAEKPARGLEMVQRTRPSIESATGYCALRGRARSRLTSKRRTILMNVAWTSEGLAHNGIAWHYLGKS